MTLGMTKIPYLDRLWHPTTGCSFGCPTCWARPLVCNRLAGTMRGLPATWGMEEQPDGTAHYEHDPAAAFAPTFHADRLCDPLRVRKPQVIGVSFLSDWCDKGIARGQRFDILAIAEKNEQRSEPHTLIFLTKQAEEQAETLMEWRDCSAAFPLDHCWFGVSVTNQADTYRIAHLLRTPAAHRWVSAEPLVGPVDLHKAAWNEGGPVYSLGIQARMVIPRGEDGWWTQGFCGTRALDLVIAGGESGPQARPCAPDWARSLRDQCAAAGVAFNWKQNGEWECFYDRDKEDPDWRNCPTCKHGERYLNLAGGHGFHGDRVVAVRRVGTKAAGRLLDGQLHDDLPWRIER